MLRIGRVLAAGGLLLACGSVLAHGGASHGASHNAEAKAEQQPWGIAGRPKAAGRTITVTMTDAMRFNPDRIRVRQGDTVRFVVRNAGRMLHEMVIGTPSELQEHAALMEKFPDMEHDAPWMVHVAAGKSGEIVWTFNRPGHFEFACLIAGHYQAGMKGSIVVAPR